MSAILNEVRPGAELLVVRTKPSQSERREAVVADSRDRVLAVRIGDWDEWRPGDEALFLMHQGGLWARSARAVTARDGVVVFKAAAQWTPWEPRGDPRYPTSIAAHLRVPGIRSAQPCTVTDVSARGLRIECQPIGRPETVEVLLHVDAFDAVLPYEVVGFEEDEDRATLHLLAGAFNQAQAAFVRSLVNSYRLAFEELCA
ncbi:MAG: PilZ domain-containing protein [Chloroflexi bacterium]|nr:PilZ domain-containing protein [Chloroflexota bacterium]